jgi:hypothetical protein
MKQILHLFFLISFILPKQAESSPLMGAEVYYSYLGGLKYEITFRVFRDCRNSSLDTSLKAEIWGISGNDTITKRLSLKRISITDLTTVCKKVSKPCNPANTQISGTDPAIEEHIYKDTVDFNTTDTVFKKCCFIKFGVGQCCRPTGTLYGGGKDFWVWSELDICAAKNNNSPIFSSIPNNILCCNQPYMFGLGGIDTVDFDSVSYSYANPMESWAKSISYPSGNAWISSYWPTGYDKNKGPNPNVNPPIGIYLDPETGDPIVTPVGCPENTFVSFKISEWRKDSTGKYKKIGEVRRDIQYIVKTCPDNNPPLLNGPYKYEVCAGQQLCFTVTSDDKQFIPPPPAKPNPPDTVTLTWNKGIGRGAAFIIVDAKARLQKGKFCWTPKESDVSNMPYTFAITANDNHCSMNSITIKSYSVKVKPINKTQISHKQLATNTVAIESKFLKPYPANPTYSWQIMDSVNNSVSVDYCFFKNNKTSVSNRVLDTIIFRKKGKYIIRHQLNNPPNNCPSVYFDTITIADVMDVSMAKTYDTLVCQGTPLKFKAKVTNGIAPFVYQWGNTKADTTSQITIVTYKDTTLELKVTDSKGNTAYSWFKISMVSGMELNAGNDKWVCKNDSVILQPSASDYGDTCYWQWFWGGNQINDKPTIKVGNAGEYILKVTDSKKCFSKYDTVKVNTVTVGVSAGLDKEICLGQSVKLNAKETTINSVKIFEWYELRNLKRDTLLIKTDSIIITPKTTANYLIKYTASLAGTTCAAYDTVNVKVNFLTIDFKTGEACQSEFEFDLHSIIINPVSSYQGIFNWQLDKTITKPGGGFNSLTDLLIDKDTSKNSHYYLKISKSNIDLKGKDFDTLKLSLIYEDADGCKRNSKSQALIIIKTNINLALITSEISRCQRDSINSISNSFGINYKGGQWFTNNDSVEFLKWPQGHSVLLNEKIQTNNLNSAGGKYLMKYFYDYKGCQSFTFARLNILNIPQLHWSKLIVGDSIVLTDNSTDYFGREWHINSTYFKGNKSIKISIADAKTKEIKLLHSNSFCKTVDIITPFSTSVNSLFSKGNILIYPNPTKSKLNIEINKAGKYFCKVYSIIGQVVLERNIEGLHPEILDIKLPNGYYTLIIEDVNSNSIRTKLIVE